ncbi:MAG: NADH-quinone oxidoreductase subunit L [Planctomyces sp.]
MVGETLRNLLLIAWLLPLCGFAVEIFGGFWGSRRSRVAAWLAVGCIATGFVCSASALTVWGNSNGWSVLHHADHAHAESGEKPADAHAEAHAAAADQHKVEDQAHGGAEATKATTVFSGTFYRLATFGGLDLSLDYYIDSLTLVMFTMVTFIATCIHLFAMGYMSEELTEEYVDHHAHLRNGHHVHRPGRFYRFFAFLSLFCFSMLGLVLAGNIFQVFIFWELVGICSFLLIGFYTERKSASTAANKAFIMNRVGDFGFLIGLMVLWTYFGTFKFADTVDAEGHVVQAGLFQMLPRGADGNVIMNAENGEVQIGSATVANPPNRHATIPYALLVLAGLGVFAGCIGKSAQFPLQTWLPDAMEGPTPVSALVHSATMVAAGVYLTGRFYPMFVQEVLLTIAYIGCITAFVAATIAIVATDIKKVLAYSTISQLGYMMLGLGVFGWGAGLFHLVTHAFFKSLMFLCSGSVIYGCHHEQEMPKMGGLWRKMPITAFTMLVGVMAIAGLAVPGLVGPGFGQLFAFSGFHSKDAVVATALAFVQANPAHFLLFILPLITAGVTAFYMFRLWFYTFAGTPRDHHVYDHCHESPLIMTGPLVVLSLLAAYCAWGGEEGRLYLLITGDQPGYVSHGLPAAAAGGLTMPGHDAVHAVHHQAGTYALIAAFSGTFLAWLLYGSGKVDVAEIRRQLAGVHGFLSNKWHFDELYDALFMRPTHVVGRFCAGIDRMIFDGILHGAAGATVLVAKWDRAFDEKVVDGLVTLLGNATWSAGNWLKVLQTGRLRQYVMFIVAGVVALFGVLLATFPR